MSTIKIVAKEAGVSTATVSRVLNGNYPVSKEAYDKVMDAVKKTGYKGNAIAKSLKMNRTFMIGYVVPDISNSYFMEIAKGIEEIISPFGYTLTICSTNDDEDRENEVITLLNNKRVDAVVLASCHQNSDLIRELIESNLKVILFDSKLPDLKLSYVGETNYFSSKEILTYTIEKGHKDIAILIGDMRMGTARERYTAYEDTLEQYGIEVNPSYILDGGYQRQKAYQAVKNLLEGPIEVPSLIYATNNKMAEGAMIAIKEQGLSIPDDVSVISFGNISLPELVSPKLTYIEQNTNQLGSELGHLLKHMLVDKSDAVQEKIIRLEIIKGHSVKTLNS